MVRYICEWNDELGPVMYIKVNKNTIGFCLCHKSSDRSFHFLGLEKYLCSRCLGILIGGTVGLLLNIWGLGINLLLALIFSIPLIIDGSVQYYTSYESNNILRFFTGIMFGLSVNYLGSNI